MIYEKIIISLRYVIYQCNERGVCWNCFEWFSGILITFFFCLNQRVLEMTMFLGTHWMSNILHFLKTDSLESPKTAPIIELFTIEEIASWPSPRILHTHTFPYFLPEGSLKAGRKIVLMYRNPKDTAVSMFHHFRQDDGMGGKLTISWKCFFETWVRGIG